MAPGQGTQTGNAESGVDIPCEEVYTVENSHHGMRHLSNDEDSG